MTTATQGRTRAAKRYPSQEQRLLVQTYRQILGNAMAATYDQMRPYIFQIEELQKPASLEDTELQIETIRWLVEVLLLVRNGFRKSDLEVHGIFGISVPLKERTRKYRGLKRFIETANLEESYTERLEGALTGIDLALNRLLKVMPGQLVEKLVKKDKLDQAEDLLALTYLQAMKVLRAAWTQLFYSTHVTTVARWDLSNEESKTWHKYMERWHEPPPFLLMDPEKLANERNTIVHVYDNENELVFEALPAEYLASVPWAEWSTARQSRGEAKFQWHYKKYQPTKVKQFERELTPVEKQRITDFLGRRQQLNLPALPISEVAALTGAGTVTKTQEPHEWQRNPKKVSKADQQVLSEYMLHRKIWTMDLG